MTRRSVTKIVITCDHCGANIESEHDGITYDHKISHWDGPIERHEVHHIDLCMKCAQKKLAEAHADEVKRTLHALDGAMPDRYSGPIYVLTTDTGVPGFNIAAGPLGVYKSLEAAQKRQLPSYNADGTPSGSQYRANSWEWEHTSFGHWYCYKTKAHVYERYVF